VWSLVAERLRRAGHAVLVPDLADRDDSSIPYWGQHAASVARAIGPAGGGRPLAFVAHSGAGPLLPAIRAATPYAVAAYVFVDAGLPHDGRSRLDEIADSVPALAAELRPHLAAGGRFPEWTDDDLREEVPDRHQRQLLVADLRPRGLAFFEEVLPDFAEWPDAPCAYLRLSTAYAGPAAEAARRGWPCRTFDAGHFHMLVDPDAATAALLDLMREAA
jgi:hypothetical protein